MKTNLRTKIQNGFTVVNGLMLLVALIGIVALLVVRQNSNRAMYTGARLNAIGLDIQKNNLLARRYEKDFLLDIKRLGVAKSKELNASQVPLATEEIVKLANEGAQIAVDAQNRDQLKAVPALAHTYLNEFEAVVAAIERRGHIDSGAEGAFRAAVHQIEAQLKDSKDVEIALLTLRRSEKDYLLRGGTQYIQKTLENAAKLKAAINSAPYPAAEKEEGAKLADAYVTAFTVLTEADRLVAEKTALYNAATSRLETVSDAVAKAGSEQSAQYLSSAATTAWVSIVLVLLTSAAAVGLGVHYAARLSGNVTKPVMELTDVAERVSLGDLSVAVDRTSDDEIGELQEALKRLVFAVKFFQMESDASLAEARKELK